MNITDFLIALVPFTHEELNDILSHFEKEYVSKNQLLIRDGQVCNKLYFVEQGIGRSYYIKNDGKEVTQWFFGVDNFMTSLESFFNQSPSFYYLEVLEDSILYSISYENLELLLAKYHHMERFIRLLSLEMFSKIIYKLNAIQFQTAKERYNYMISDFPDISYRVPLGYIASYLGMTQETLSRIRKNQI
ncbi:MAG: Crp/Fnr family transcriptional regulator [Polaribacter sp.]